LKVNQSFGGTFRVLATCFMLVSCLVYGGNTFFRIVGWISTDYTVLHPRRQNFQNVNINPNTKFSASYMRDSHTEVVKVTQRELQQFAANAPKEHPVIPGMDGWMKEPCSREIRASVTFKETALSRINVKGKVGMSDAEEREVTKNRFHLALKLSMLRTRFIVWYNQLLLLWVTSMM
jgi:hypothetical protein